MNKKDRLYLTDKIIKYNKINFFNGEMLFNSKKMGWKSITGGEAHFYKDLLEPLTKSAFKNGYESWDGNDIVAVEKTLRLKIPEILLTPSRTVYTPNFKIDLNTGIKTRLTPKDKEKYIIGVKHDPMAISAIQWWDDMLARSLNNDQESIRAYYEMLGLSGITDKSLEASYWVLGKAGTGKSTLVGSVINGIHHQRNMSFLPPEQWNENGTVFYTIANKLVNYSPESESGKNIPTSTFKKLASGEKVSANIKYKDPIYFIPSALLISVTNEIPRMKEGSDGPFRRMVMLRFENEIDKNNMNYNLKKDIENNKDNVLNYIIDKAIKAAVEVFKRNAVTQPQISKDTILETQMENNSAIAWWIEEQDDIAKKVSQVADNLGYCWTTLLKEYRLWAVENGYIAYHKGNFIKAARRVLENQLKDRFEIKRHKNKEYVVVKETYNNIEV